MKNRELSSIAKLNWGGSQHWQHCFIIPRSLAMQAQYRQIVANRTGISNTGRAGRNCRSDGHCRYRAELQPRRPAHRNIPEDRGTARKRPANDREERAERVRLEIHPPLSRPAQPPADRRDNAAEPENPSRPQLRNDRSRRRRWPPSSSASAMPW